MRSFVQHQKIRSHTTEHSTTLKEKYDQIKQVMEQIKYLDHYRVICVNLQMLNVLLD